MAKNTTNPDLPPVEGNPEADPNYTPPIVMDTDPTATPAPASVGKQVEVTRIPEPVLTGGRVVFPNAYGVDYTVDDNVVRGALPIKKDEELKVVASVQPGFKFGKGLKRTFNLKG